MKFPQRGKYDNSATPNEIYKLLINELGFVDVCVDPSRFDFLREEAPDRAYCNPPFSSKFLFIEKACEVSRKGKLIVLLLPADISTRWFTKAFLNVRHLSYLLQEKECTVDEVGTQQCYLSLMENKKFTLLNMTN